MCTEEYHAQYTIHYRVLDNKRYCSNPKWILFGRSCTGCGRKFVDKVQYDPKTEFCPSNAGTHTRSIYHCQNLKPLTANGSCSHVFCDDCFTQRQARTSQFHFCKEEAKGLLHRQGGGQTSQQSKEAKEEDQAQGLPNRSFGESTEEFPL